MDSEEVQFSLPMAVYRFKYPDGPVQDRHRFARNVRKIAEEEGMVFAIPLNWYAYDRGIWYAEVTVATVPRDPHLPGHDLRTNLSFRRMLRQAAEQRRITRWQTDPEHQPQGWIPNAHHG